VHWVGQTIGVIVAVSRDVAQRASAAVTVTYDELPAIVTIDVRHPLTACYSLDDILSLYRNHSCRFFGSLMKWQDLTQCYATNSQNISLAEYTLCPKKTCDYIFYNNFNNKCPITIIFGIVSSKSMHHRKMVSFPTSPI